MHVAAAFLVGMLTTFIVLYAIQVRRHKRLLDEHAEVERKLKKRWGKERQHSELWSAYHTCAARLSKYTDEPYDPFNFDQWK